MSFHAPNKHRHRGPDLYGTEDGAGNNGAFYLPARRLDAAPLKVIASDGGGWEHVSVSLPDRCPSWHEMCHVKSLFWDAEDAVMQLHPPASDYVNQHPYCLHLWRPSWEGAVIPLPPSWMVGVKSTEEPK